MGKVKGLFLGVTAGVLAAFYIHSENYSPVSKIEEATKRLSGTYTEPEFEKVYIYITSTCIYVHVLHMHAW